MTPEAFREARRKVGWSIRAAAKHLETTPTTIQRWESGKSRIPSEAADLMGAEAQDVAAVMTNSERQEMVLHARRRARVAKASAKQRRAELMADFERELADEKSIFDETWVHLTKEAAQRVKEVDEQIAAMCRERGTPEAWRPSISVTWYGRGENAYGPRRDELRKVAISRLEAMERAAIAAIDRATVEVETALLAEGLRSDRGRQMLEAMPSAESLLPPLDLAAVRSAVPGAGLTPQIAPGVYDVDDEDDLD
jgi:transcriptional regulator with XRE-family HTH domain